jgi:hypothetical protein
VSTIVWHFQIAHEDSIGDSLFAKSVTKIFNCILKPFSAIKTSCVNKYGKLVWVILWDQLNGSNRYCTDFRSPPIMLLESSESGGSDFRGELGLEWQLALEL